jgi:hypothetical protein
MVATERLQAHPLPLEGDRLDPGLIRLAWHSGIVAGRRGMRGRAGRASRG